MLTEREVQEVWALGMFRRSGLRTEDGRGVAIEFAGFPSGEGPDFRAARIAFDGEARSGDVEIHLTPCGWASHGHGEQHSYANVILHVALRRDAFGRRVQTSVRRTVPELVLEPHLEVPEVELRRLLCGGPEARPGRQVEWLERLGERRFERTAARLARLAGVLGPDEALYRELMTGLGYQANKAPFAELARIVSWVEASRERLQAAARGLPWRLSVRPANRPERRLEGFCRFASSVPGRSPAAAARQASDPARFFDPGGDGLIGPDRALALWTSAVLPMVRDRRAFDAFAAIPENRRIREARAALGVPPPQTLRAQWGLLEWRNEQ